MEAGEANVMKNSRGRVVSLGVHIVDILGRPVTHIPPGQGRQLLDEIRITAAGTAAGTSVDLAKLGAEVIAMGAIGDDRLADFLIWPKTKKDTVNAALREVGQRLVRLRALAGLSEMADRGDFDEFLGNKSAYRR